jgi:hypothetical protein
MWKKNRSSRDTEVANRQLRSQVVRSCIGLVTWSHLVPLTLRPTWKRPRPAPVINRTPGAVAFSRSGDPNLGEFEDAVILKTFADVPEVRRARRA